jgi:hypothetical protein
MMGFLVLTNFLLNTKFLIDSSFKVLVPLLQSSMLEAFLLLVKVLNNLDVLIYEFFQGQVFGSVALVV